MVAKLESRGADVITAERAVELGYGVIHQSGHAIGRDTKLLYSLLKPKEVVVPMHGDGNQVEANARLAKSLGIPALALEHNGDVVRVNDGKVTVTGHEDVNRIGAQENPGEVKALPRARKGEGRGAQFPPTVYRYDELDESGRTVLRRNIHPTDTPVRHKKINMAKMNIHAIKQTHHYFR